MPTLDILGGAANAAVGGALGIGTAAINSSIQNNQQANLMQMQDRYNEIRRNYYRIKQKGEYVLPFSKKGWYARKLIYQVII